MRQPVVACCDAPKVLQPVEGILDEPSQLVEAPVEAERLFSATPVGNDGLRSTLLQRLAQLGAIVGLVAEHVFGWFYLADEMASQRAVMRLASGQQDGKKASLSISECVNLRIAPSS